MSVDAIIHASFQSNVKANQAVNKALVGHALKANGTGPFKKVGTAAYSCQDADEIEVGQALVDLSAVLNTHSLGLDSVSISIVRKRS